MRENERKQLFIEKNEGKRVRDREKGKERFTDGERESSRFSV